MRLAFGLDNTLIRGAYDFPLETPKRRFWARLLRHEPLRAGVVELVTHCQQRGWEVWVYTTSYRSGKPNSYLPLRRACEPQRGSVA